MENKVHQDFLNLTRIEQQEQEVLRLSPIVENLPTYLASKNQAVRANYEMEQSKLLLQLKTLKKNAEEGLKENPAYAKNLATLLRSAFIIAVEKSFPKTGFAKDLVVIGPASNPRFGDYQCNVAMAINKHLKNSSLNPRSIAEKVVENFPVDPYNLIDKLEVAGPGFINIYVGKQFVVEEVRNYMIHGLKPQPQKRMKVLVDQSSPNVAKEMHVGHLRSTIMGDTFSNLFEYQGHDVLKINHVGDWGTQFGMLIVHLKDTFPNGFSSLSVQELMEGYKESKKRFDGDEEFKKRAYKAVVCLQNKDPAFYEPWKVICETSRREFQIIYERLGVKNLIERGESFYQDRMVKVVKLLEDKNLLEEDEGRRIMFPKSKRLIPLTVVKTDGGYTYDTSDMATIKQRIEEDCVDRVVYVTDAGQATHFYAIFDCAEQAGILDRQKVRVDHVGFGVVLGEDKKKFKTRSGDTVRLKELLDEGVKRAREKLIEKGRDEEMTPEELELAEKSLAYGCIKYADLSHNRNHEYVFSFDKMLDDKGNTAVYLLYTYTRIKSIARKANVTMEQLTEYAKSPQFDLTHERELKLSKKLLKFSEVIDRCLEDLFIHPLCEFMYDICVSFSEFYDVCYCIEIDQKTGEKTVNMNRLVLCEATAIVLKKCFDLIGICPVSKM